MTKFVAKLLILVIVLSSLFTLVGCTFKLTPKWRSLNTSFMVTIKGVKQQKVIDFEISKSYYLTIKLFDDVVVDDDTYKDIQIEYNEENAVVTYAYDSPKSKEIKFTIYLYELGKDDKLKITYNGKTIEVGYSIIDYDFEANGYEPITSIDALDKYPEFKEMLLSIKYHEFQEPYIGLNKWEYDVQRDGAIYFRYYRTDYKSKYMSPVYLQYLTDSVYYPTRFIGFDMYMFLPENTDVSKGAYKTVMDSFSLNLSVSDPHHNKRPDGITGMYFDAYNMDEYRYIYEGEEYLHPVILRLERYPEKFFKYQLGELTIYILSTKDSGATAYFTHGSYFYNISASYDFD